MLSPNTFTLLLNGITLALSLSFLLITLWQDTRKELSQFFAIFLFMVTLWNGGSLLLQAASLIENTPALTAAAISLVELGYTGSAIAIYTLTAIVVGVQTRRFRYFAFAGLFFVLAYQVLLILTNAPLRFERLGAGTFTYQIQPLSALFYLLFDTTTFYLVWRYRRKVRSRALWSGILIFVIGQTLTLLNPELQALAIAINFSSIAALIISFAILRQEIISPLSERVRQIEAMHQVSLAVTSQIALDTVLDEIATQAVGWLDADGSGIFLNQDTELMLATVFNLPKQFTTLRIALGQGVAGTAALTGEPVFVENYRRDWKGEVDLPLAKETFGSVICVPLNYGERVIGVLMVIASRQGRLFTSDDVYLLDLLGSQAAVAIAHSQLFAHQKALMQEVDTAHSQLSTVLTSTQNPVIAIDRHFRLIFANPIAQELFFPTTPDKQQSILELLPQGSLPADYREALRNLRQNRAHVYEINLRNQVYLCHLACLGYPKIAGWVAILNDITQLKELDRLKSEMVRMTSHDLKNPLQAAIANLELLSDDLADHHDPEIEKSLSAIDKQLERMNRIIGGILDLERMKSGIPAFEVCHIDRIIQNSLDEIQHLASDKHIHMEIHLNDNLPNFLGDGRQFERALINLIENAIKFTIEGGEVRLEVYQKGNEVIFEIGDSGIGIPEMLHDRIFDRFFRGRQKGADHITGSGLGLSLVKTIVENHNGRIWLKSQEGEGATFYVAVPALNVERIPS